MGSFVSMGSSTFGLGLCYNTHTVLLRLLKEDKRKKDLLSSLRFSFHKQSFEQVIFLLQSPQLCLLSLVYNEFAQVLISFFLVYVVPYVYNAIRALVCFINCV